MFYKKFHRYAGSDGVLYYCTSPATAESFFKLKPASFNATWQGTVPVYRRGDGELFAANFRGDGGEQLKRITRGVYVRWHGDGVY
ncbi:MAG: hypothetical protein GXO75_08310 [Calditrichaeota bacterium]|nr:hypothetical protein [Calditrichota bacterium]